MTTSNDLWTAPVWEPPLAGTELEHLAGALDRLRTTFRWKADDLDAAGLQARIGASSLTLGGLLKHLALVEDYTFTTKLRGEPPGAPWETIDRDGSADWDVRLRRRRHPRAALRALGRRGRAVPRAARRRAGRRRARPARDVSGPDGRHASLRRLVFDLVEEYGRHTGHADLLREAVDGRVGEDPPDDWQSPIG